MIQQLPPSVVISHTETNSFVRSDINTVYPAQEVRQQPLSIQPEHVIVKEEAEHTEEATEDEVSVQFCSFLSVIRPPECRISRCAFVNSKNI